MSIKKSIAVLACMAIVLSVAGCNGDTTPSASGTDSTVSSGVDSTVSTDGTASENSDDNNSSENSGSEATDEMIFKATDKNVKTIGRTFLDSDETIWLSNSASAIEFTFTGKSAKINVCTDLPYGAGSEPRFAVYVDGERTVDELLTVSEKEIEIFSADSAKEATIKIIKLSEAANSIFGIKSIVADGEAKIAPTAAKDLKIEFIGDSITCGYGVDDEVKEHSFSTATEDATKAYAYKTAELLNADYSMFSYSGHGIISGYTTGAIQAGQTIPPIYGLVGKNYSGSAIVKNEWDFSKFQPDFIVINLGTNDASYTKTDKEKQREYTDGYKAFLKQVREKNPDAFIICGLGIMGNDLYYPMDTAVKEYKAESGDENVDVLPFLVQDAADGYAADWHPTEATHTKAADRLKMKIELVMQAQNQ